MLKRPHPKEIDDDLLVEQEKFLASSNRPSVSFVNKRKDRKEIDTRVYGQNENKVDKNKEENFGDKIDKIEEKILSDVTECNTTSSQTLTPHKVEFVKPFVISSKVAPVGKKSLFASQQIRKKQKLAQTQDDNVSTSVKSGVSFVVDGSGLNDVAFAQEIHDKNVKLLNQMSEEEIIAEKKQIEATLNSSEQGKQIMEFLKSRRRNKMNENKPKELTKEESLPKISTNSLSSAKVSETASVELPVKTNPDWVHMDVVETNKLQWTTDLPPVTKEIVNFTARFDLDGNLLGRDVDIPTYHGLHHHGEEPEVAGYSLEEVFTFIRSSFSQQRLLGLRILANILAKANRGHFDACLESFLVPNLLSSGVLILLRWSLDDSSLPCIESTLNCFSSLLYIESDEASLHRVFSWPNGMVFPFLNCSSTNNDMKETTDVQLASVDVIKALLRMDFLPRIHYILDSFEVSYETVICIFGILTRIVRHSLSSAKTVADTEPLMKLIMKYFLPNSWTTANKAIYGVPSVHALRFVVVLCSCSREISTLFVKKYLILNSLTRYLTSDQSEISTWPDLVLESFRLWKVLISFGLGTGLYLDLFPWIMNLLLTFNKLSVVTGNAFEQHLAKSTISFLESVVGLIYSQLDDSTLSWSNVVGVVDLVSNHLRRWLSELNHANSISDVALQLVSCCLSFFAQCCKCLREKAITHASSSSKIVDGMCTKCLIPFWKSSLCTSLLLNLKRFSWFANDIRSGSCRYSPSLPSYSAICFNGNLTPILEDCSPYHFFSSFFSCLFSIHQLSCDDADKLMMHILTDKNIVDSLNESVINSELNWFSRYELYYKYNLVKLATEMVDSKNQFYHSQSFFLLSHLMNGDEVICEDLFSSVIFNGEFLKDHVELCGSLSNLTLADKFHLKSPALLSQENITSSQLLHLSYDNITDIKDLFIKAFTAYKGERNEDSFGISYGIKRIFSLPWIFLPLEIARKRSLTCGREKEKVTWEIIRNLECFYLFSSLRSPLLQVDVCQVYFFIASIFLFADDLFFENSIHLYLANIFVNYFSTVGCHGKILPDSKLPDETSFRDFYLQLISQFEAVSYGDDLFSLYVLFPLQQQFDFNFRLALWSEHSLALRSISITAKQLPIPLCKYLFPLETQPRVLSAYFQALTSKSVAPRNSLLYLVAIHHLHHYLFPESNLHNDSDGGDANLRSRMMKCVMKNSNLEPHCHVINYVQPNIDASLGFDLNK